MIIVTGGAGFVGSCVVRTLNDLGIDDILIVDNIAKTGKWRNLINKKFISYMHKSVFLEKKNSLHNVRAVIHMGAQSSTTEKNFDYLWNNNFEYTKILWNYCVENGISFIYASSAATYGDGTQGFDDCVDIDLLRPLNGYGYSKHLFDLWVKHHAKSFPVQHVGLKFFNVFGPNEYCKESMASMVYHGYNQIKENGKIRLFKSGNPKFKNGNQLRDFVYVKDICSVIIWFMEHKQINGLFNVGTGCARSFNDLANALFNALDIKPNIEYFDMPEQLQGKYQYYTKAEMSKLRSCGYEKKFFDLESGVYDYVTNYLTKDFEVY